MSRPPRWRIAGQGLAGTCLAWQLIRRGENPEILTDGRDGSSRVAAGLVNPVTGKNFEPSWLIAPFLAEAADFYRAMETLLGVRFWHPLPLLRLARDAREWSRIEGKLGRDDIRRWVAGRVDPPAGWHAAVELAGAARLDTRVFLDASREALAGGGHLRDGEMPAGMMDDPFTIACDGAAGLLGGRLGPHRCAMGEILTLHAPHWPQSHIRIGGGGWLVPIGRESFKAGATYEWNNLATRPTAAGRARVAEIASALAGDAAFTITGHHAGIRPILRRSQPLIGRHPAGGWIFNGLGSKGTLYAPGCARRLAESLVGGHPIEAEFDFPTFLNAGC